MLNDIINRDFADYLNEIQTVTFSISLALQALAERQTDALLCAQLITLKAASENCADKAFTLKDIMPERNPS